MAEPLAFAVAVIVNERGEVLFVKRSETKALAPGKWGFPGGKLEPGEDPETAMRRELREELGADIRLEDEGRLGPLPAEGLLGARVHLFRYRWLGGVIALDPEHTRFAWIDAAAYPSLDVLEGVRADLDYFGLLKQ